MAIVLRQNQYKGVNPHLNSHLQEADNWIMFHTAHITYISELLDARLPSGYEIGLEKSLQIMEYHPDTGERIRPPRRPYPDVTVYEISAIRRADTGVAKETSVLMPTLTIPALETMWLDNDELYLRAVVIYDIRVRDGRRPVTRIELLSPTNKPLGSGFLQYTEKRDATLRQQMPLMEIDYLHETPPVPLHVPSYPDREAKSHPYAIYITDTRPSLEKGLTHVYSFDVDDAIPLVNIPLLGDDVLPFDFGTAYNRTFESMSYFRNHADYAQLPLRFETYAPSDQERIRARMTEVASAFSQT
jgi:hypothetical protein